ncbi:MAG TPA: VOC family protein [Candidatus Binataceae bacterium]|nr:VOC family protein [Candidatus Binataceae bacterium]
MAINSIARVIVAVTDMEASRARWTQAGFGVSEPCEAGAMRIATIGAGAIAIDLCATANNTQNASFAAAIARGGGAIGWLWGVDRVDASNSEAKTIELLDSSGALARVRLDETLEGTLAGAIASLGSLEDRRNRLSNRCGANPNTVSYLEHIVVMTPSLENAIARVEAIGVPCKRIREAGRGVRQAFFKLEQTVIEVVAPAPNGPRIWGLAFMCDDIRRAVEVARAAGLQATEPKAAIQGGMIARIGDPIDNLAIAFMQAAQ